MGQYQKIQIKEILAITRIFFNYHLFWGTFYKINESGRNLGRKFTPTVRNMCETGPSDTLDKVRLELQKHLGTVPLTTVL